MIESNSTHPLLQAGKLTGKQVATFLGNTQEVQEKLMFKLNVKSNDTEVLNRLITQFFNNEDTFYLTLKTGTTRTSPMILNVRFVMTEKRATKLFHALNNNDVTFTLKK